MPTGTVNGLILVETSGGTFIDPITKAHIQLDASVHLRALHWLDLFEDRGTTIYVTPAHDLIEARFRYKMTVRRDTVAAAHDAYSEVNAYLGGLDWEKVIPADLSKAAISPTDEVRAAFVLGGFTVLTEGIRTQSNASPQAVNLMTFVAAAAQDFADSQLDGNDLDDRAPRSGLQVGSCAPIAPCVVPSDGCQLGACRAACDLYVNTYRSQLADAISQFIGSKDSPNSWNQTTLGSDDARVLIDNIADDRDPGLFGMECLEPQHQAPPTIFWEVSPPDDALEGGMIKLRVHAVDSDSNKFPTVRFQGNYEDTDGDPNNEFATITVDTRTATHGTDGPLPITAIATNVAGNMSTSTRTFQIDNTAPLVTLDSSGLYVDAANVWWTATPGPTLHGAVSDAHGLMQVVVMIGGSVVATATVDGSQWSAKLPMNALSLSGNDVAIVAFDVAGNSATKVQTIRLDTTPPSVTMDPSPVSDEVNSLFSWIDNDAGSFAVHTEGLNRHHVVPSVYRRHLPYRAQVCTSTVRASAGRRDPQRHRLIGCTQPTVGEHRSVR